MYLRQLTKALDHHDVRDLIDAEHFAQKRGKPLTVSITVHPKFLDQYPADMGQWISWLLNKLRIWCDRDRGFGYYAIWVRENYEGDRREHIHILLHIPKGERPNLEDVLRRWLHGKDNVVELREPKYRQDRYGQRTNKALTYMLKQMTPQARYSLGGQVYRENKCRETHAPVAPVLGRRCGTSRSLNAKTRETLWSVPTQTSVQRRAPRKLGLDRKATNKKGSDEIKIAAILK
jgi:hypothetical protein